MVPWDIKCLSTGGRPYLQESHQISKKRKYTCLLSPPSRQPMTMMSQAIGTPGLRGKGKIFTKALSFCMPLRVQKTAHVASSHLHPSDHIYSFM